jgi:hypothetical protein
VCVRNFHPRNILALPGIWKPCSSSFPLPSQHSTCLPLATHPIALLQLPETYNVPSQVCNPFMDGWQIAMADDQPSIDTKTKIDKTKNNTASSRNASRNVRYDYTIMGDYAGGIFSDEVRNVAIYTRPDFSWQSALSVSRSLSIKPPAPGEYAEQMPHRQH